MISSPLILRSTRLLVVVIALLALLLPGAPALPAHAAPGSQEFTYGLKAEPAGLDPALFGPLDASTLVTMQIYDTLVIYSPGGSTPQPGLISSWSVSSDGLAWTLNVRPGVTFHDGTALDADAVLFNLRRWWDPAHPYHVGEFPYFMNAFFGYRGDPVCLITGLEKTGPMQLRIDLAEPRGSLLSMLAYPGFAIASPAAIQAGTLATHPVGTGPFTFGSWTAGDLIQLNANPGYWAGAPASSILKFRIIPDDAARFAATSAGTVNMTAGLDYSYVAAANADSNLRVLWQPDLNTGYLGINRSVTPLNDALVRQAIAHAIDKQALIAGYYHPGTQTAVELVPPSLFGYNPAVVDYSYDPGLAEVLLAQAGYPNGFSINLALRDVERTYLPQPVATANAIKGYLDAVGIQTTVSVMESEEFVGKAFGGELELFLLGWGAGYPHPNDFYEFHFCDQEVMFGPKDVALCTQITAAGNTGELNSQLTQYHAIAVGVHDTLPMIPLAHDRTFLVQRKEVAGVVPSLDLVQRLSGATVLANWLYLPTTQR